MKKFRIALLCLVVLALSMLCLTACQKVVTITFKTQGGEMEHSTEISVKYGDAVELPIPTRSDSEFIGWFLGRSPEAEQVTDETTYRKDTILYARWKTYGSEGLEFEINEFNNGAICVGIGTFEGNFLEIPAWYEDLPVVKIKEHAFRQNTMIVGVKLPEKLQEIGAYAFEHCTNLTEIELNDSLESIGEWAFGYTMLSEIDFPASLKTIGGEAFYVSKLTHVTIPSTITDIGEYAFAFTELEEVTFEKNSSLTVISNGLFLECDKLTSIEFPDSVTTIGSSALNSCFNLQSVVIHDSVKTIEHGAFYNCTALQSLFIPASVEVMGFNILGEENEVIVCCEAKSQPSTWSLNWNSNYDNVYWDALELQEEGDFVVVKNDRNVRLIEYVGEKTDVVVPSEINGLEVVGFKNIFAENTELVSIVVSEGITSLEEGAFRNCSSLVSVSLPSTIESIGKYVFQGCNSLETLIVDENNKHFSDSGNCLISIESKTLLFGFKNSVIPADGSVVALASNSFNGSSIEYIAIPSSVKSIGYRAFAFSNLRNYTLEQPSQLQEIGIEAFYMCEMLETINIPETLVTLGKDAFLQCENVKSILGGSESYAVRDGQLIETASGTLLKGYVVGTLVVGDEVKSIYDYAFLGNNELTEVVIPDSVETVGYSAFANCNAIASMTMPFVGNSRYMKQFLGYVFGGDTVLDNVDVCPQSLKKVVLTDVVGVTPSAFYGCSYIEEVQVPDDVYSIGFSAFEDCRSLTTFNMPSQLKEISNEAFKGCTSLNSVEFPDTLTSIGYMAFAETTSLDSVVVPLSVEYVGGYAFETSVGKTVKCERVRQSTEWDSDWDSGLTVVWGYNNIEDGDYSYILKDDGVHLTDYRGTDTHLVVPETLGGNTVVSLEKVYSGKNFTTITLPSTLIEIGERDFANCKMLETLVIPQNIQYIGEYAFLGCESLTSVQFETGSQLQQVGEGVFADCNSLVSMVVPFLGQNKDGSGEPRFLYWFGNVNAERYPESLRTLRIDGCTVIGGSALRGFAFLENLEIGNSVQEILSGAFASCVNLRSVVFEEGIQLDYLGASAFDSCRSLESIQLPDTLSVISASAFNNCQALTYIKIPDSVREILDKAFMSCRSLKQIDLGGKIISIGEYAFTYCSSLIEISIPETVTSIGEFAFAFCDGLKRVDLNASVDNIANNLFRGCGNLRYISIPEGVKVIYNQAFWECSGLISVVIPQSLTEIGVNSFFGCTKLIEVVNLSQLYITEGSLEHGEIARYAKSVVGIMEDTMVDVVGDYIFLYDDGYSLISYYGTDADIVLPNDIYGSSYSIASMAFSNDSTLNSITLSEGVNAICEQAFYNCSNLTRLYIPESVTTVDQRAVDICHKVTIYCETDSAPQGWNVSWNHYFYPVVWGYKG